MPTIPEQAQSAIQSERTGRNYAAITGPTRRAYSIAGILMPRELEAYVAETECTVEHKNGVHCLWVDWAFRLPDGTFRVVLENDLHRAGMMIEQSVRVLFAKMQEQAGQGNAIL